MKNWPSKKFNLHVHVYEIKCIDKFYSVISDVERDKQYSFFHIHKKKCSIKSYLKLSEKPTFWL